LGELMPGEFAAFCGGAAMAKGGKTQQQRLCEARGALAQPMGHPFYEQVNALLGEEGCDRFCEERCARFYAETLSRPRARRRACTCRC